MTRASDPHLCAPLPSDIYRKPSFSVRKGHPRVYLTDSDLPTLRERIKHPENAVAYRLLSEYAAADLGSGLLPPCASESTRFYNYDETMLIKIEAKAFLALLEGREDLGREAIACYLGYARTLDIRPTPKMYTPGYMNDQYNAFGFVFYVGGEIYDWCYAWMTDDERAEIVYRARHDFGPRIEVGYPPTRQGAVTGHGSEFQLLRDWLAFGIATYDEYPDIFDFVAGRIESEFVPVRNYYYRSGAHHQGNSYGHCRHVPDLIAQLLVRVGCGRDLFDQRSLADVGRSFLYNLRPDDTLLRLGDDQNERFPIYSLTLTYAGEMFMTGAICRDPYCRYEAKRLWKDFTDDTIFKKSLTPVFFLILNDPTLEPLDHGTLPTAVYHSSPQGSIIARRRWDDPASPMIYFKIGELFSANHEHKDAGQFQIFYRGILAEDSGFYDAYGTPVDRDYSKSTLAHNCILIRDPEENTYGCRNVGGQKSEAAEVATIDDWLYAGYTLRGRVIGRELSFDDRGECRYAYLAGDLTGAYAPEKASCVRRYMMAHFTDEPTRPLVLFILDRITSPKPMLQKTFLLHFESEPTLEDGRSIIRHGDGALVAETLLPGDAERELIEGSFVIDGESLTFTRFREQALSAEKGWGRLEISPKRGNETDLILHAMCACDSALADDLPRASLFLDEAVVGASHLGYAAFFPRETLSLTAPFTVRGEGDGNLHYSITGLAPGRWQVQNERDEVICSALSTVGIATLHFDAPAGSYTITPLTA